MEREFVKNVKNTKSEKGERERKRELSSVGIWKGFEFGRGRPKVDLYGRVQCPSTLLPITILGPLRKCTVGGGKCEKCKVRKGWKGKEEEVKCSTNMKGFWIWKRSTQSHFVWEGPMSINLASHHDPWTTEEVYCGRWEMWKMQSPKRVKGKGRGSKV